MLVHVVLFNFRPDVEPQKRAEILEDAKITLPALPGVNHLLVGKSIKSDSQFEYALSMYFADHQALRIYRDDPEHARFRDDRFFPFLDKVQGLDYEG